MSANTSVDFWEVARRAETGQIIKESDFDLKVVFQNCAELAKDHDLVFDPENLVVNDNTLADDLWNAGYELLLKSGVYNLSTQRVIKFHDNEIKEALRFLKGNVKVGRGKDSVTLAANRTGTIKPVLFSGPFNADISCDMFIPINQAFAQEPHTNILFGSGHIRKIQGSEIRKGSAFEIDSASSAMEWTFEALKKAGRPGMPVCFMPVGGVTSMNEIAAVCPQEIPKSDHFRIIYLFPELKTDDTQLSKLAHFRRQGYNIYSTSVSLIGGIAGGPVGTAITAVAFFLASLVMSGSEVSHFGVVHMKQICTTNPASLWVNSIATQAVQRNSNIIPTIGLTTAARPGSIQDILEIAGFGTTVACSGGNISGPRAATPLGENCVNPLDTRLLGEIRDKCNSFCII